MKSQRSLALFLAVLLGLLGIRQGSAQTGAPVLTSSSYTPSSNSNPGVVTLTGVNLAPGATVSLALLSPDNNPGQTLYAIDPTAVTVLSDSSMVVKLAPSLFTNYRYFRQNGITDLRPGTYYLRVTNPDGTASNFQSFQVALQTFFPPQPLGWQMVSSPYTFGQGFGGLGVFAAAWQPQLNGGQGQYVVSYSNPPGSPADTFHPGQGYWVFVTQPVAIQGPPTGTIPVTPFSIPLQAGWNQVGDPFLSSVPLSNLSIQGASGTVSFASALGNNTVSPLYAYDASQMTYITLSADTQTIDPWVGEWLYSTQPATLVITPSVVNEYTVTGQVVSSQTGLPIPAQVLGLPGGQRNYPNGHIYAAGVPNGLYTLTVSSTGFTGQITAARVSDGNVNLFRIRLDPQAPGASGAARNARWIGQGNDWSVSRSPGRQTATSLNITSLSFSSSSQSNTATVSLTGNNYVQGSAVQLTISSSASNPNPPIITINPPNVTFNSSSLLTFSLPVNSSGQPDLSSFGITVQPPFTMLFRVRNPDGTVSDYFPYMVIDLNAGGTTTGGVIGPTPGAASISATFTPTSGSSPGFVTITGTGFDSTYTVLENPPGQTLSILLPPGSPGVQFQLVNGFPTFTITLPAGAPTGQYTFGVLNTTTSTPSNVAPVTVTGGAGGTTTGGATTGTGTTGTGTTGTGTTGAGTTGAPSVANATYAPGDPDTNTSSVITLTGTNLAQINTASVVYPTGLSMPLYAVSFDHSMQQLKYSLASPLEPGDYQVQLQGPGGSTTTSLTIAQPSVSGEVPPPDANYAPHFFADTGGYFPTLDSATYDDASTITLNGLNFVAGDRVTLSGPAASIASLTLQFTLVSATQITVTLNHPLSTPGTYTVRASRAALDTTISSNPRTFSVGGSTPILYAAHIEPSGLDGLSSPVLILSGYNFYQDLNNLVVIVNGQEYRATDGLRFDPNALGEIQVVFSSVPSPGTYAIQVRNPDGQLSGTLSVNVGVLLSIKSVLYFRSTQGSTLVISGSGFRNQTTVQVDFDNDRFYAGTITDNLIVASNPNILSTLPDPNVNPHILEVRSPDGEVADQTFTVSPDTIGVIGVNGGNNALRLLNDGRRLAIESQSYQTFSTPNGPVLVLLSSPVGSSSSGSVVAAGSQNMISNDGGSLITQAGTRLLGSELTFLIGQDGSIIPLSPSIFSSLIASGSGNLTPYLSGGNIITQYVDSLYAMEESNEGLPTGGLIFPRAGLGNGLGAGNSLFNSGGGGFLRPGSSGLSSENGAGPVAEMSSD